jgi:hypothetical protein
LLDLAARGRDSDVVTKPTLAVACLVIVAVASAAAISKTAIASDSPLYCVDGVSTTLPVVLHASSITAGEGAIPFTEDNAAYVLKMSRGGLFYLGYDPRDDPLPGWFYVASEGPSHLEPGYTTHYAGPGPCRSPASTHPPRLAGSAQVGATLTCTRGSWRASPPVTFAYSWLKGGRTIAGATSNRRRLTKKDEAASIACRVRATNSSGSASATSDVVHVAKAARPTLYCVNGASTILPVVLHARSVTKGRGDIPFTKDNAAYVLEMSRGGLFYLGYDPRNDPVPGWYFVASEGPTHLEPGYTTNYASRGACTPPDNTRRPALVGPAEVGRTVTCTPGAWLGSPPLRFAYSWLRGARTIAGAKGDRRRLTGDDEGASISCRVRASNSSGSTSATSKALRVR